MCDVLAPVSQEMYFGPSCQCNPDLCFNVNWTSTSSPGVKVSGLELLVPFVCPVN